MALNLLHSLGWPLTHSNPPALVFRMQGLLACTTIFGTRTYSKKKKRKQNKPGCGGRFSVPTLKRLRQIGCLWVAGQLAELVSPPSVRDSKPRWSFLWTASHRCSVASTRTRPTTKPCTQHSEFLLTIGFILSPCPYLLLHACPFDM